MNHNNKLKVFSGRANVPLAEKIAQCLGDPLGKLTLQNFPDGEFHARIDEDVRDPQTDKPLKIEVAQGTKDPFTTIFEYTRMSAPSLMSAALVLLLTIFMLLQYRDLRDRMVRLMGTAEMGRSTQAFDEASGDLAHYLLLQSGVNATFGVFVAISLWAIGIPSPVLWGALTAVLRFVPYVGVLLSAAFPMALAAMIDPGWWKLIETAAIFVVGDPLLGQFVEPLLVGLERHRQHDLHAAVLTLEVDGHAGGPRRRIKPAFALGPYPMWSSTCPRRRSTARTPSGGSS